MSKEKRLTLNAEKRNTISNVFQSHWEREDSPVMQNYNKAKNTYNQVREQMKKFVEVIVRKYQPEEDIETVRAMNKNMVVVVGNYITIIVLTLDIIIKKLIVMVMYMMTMILLISILV